MRIMRTWKPGLAVLDSVFSGSTRLCKAENPESHINSQGEGYEQEGDINREQKGALFKM